MLWSICKQILNRKKSNGWILLALLLVFCLIWFMVDFFFVLEYNKSLTSHRDLNNTYYIELGTLAKTLPEYKEAEAEPSAGIANLYRIVNRIKEYPDVESVALCQSFSSLPGVGSYNGSEYRSATDSTKRAGIQRITFIPEEDYFRAFRHTSNQGKAISLTDFDWGNPSAVLISQMVAERLFPGESAIGKTIETSYKSPDAPRDQHLVVGVLDDLKRFNYNRPQGIIFFPQRISEQNYNYIYIAIRSKEHIPASRFIPAFKKQMSSNLRVGNYYLKNVKSLVAMEKETNNAMTNMVRSLSGLMLFFLINITLCVLGTFWYRVNVRKEEVGIRRAMGSNEAGIKKLFVLEGIILLTLILIPAMIIESQFIAAGLISTLGQSNSSYGDYLPDHTIVRFLITNAITWLLLAAIVVLAIWYPARSASRIKPVEALKDE
ncbi:putative ABC transport system permease protein [Parabacteroides sp. PF5-5]|uniref:ABC transporter permease n=1 Tax=unclassified Parabacteroides TaxID=2649774 RepID=UPI002473CD79|nr:MULTISPECIES: ABC transporter permease [unclassified Parabacteroides]MDH6305277.1 putative ABC transport system permease protein [Parabacteroides sp. PH5-39]MDH6316630.1 putative ABC transport system permease protein [Parabacteroides sp. PF5-13]MDH6320190.1 putative ABC transport system permease protein [Parabacteroides sp. PH5-13]MDH6323867.1 putative ABC transport system permease protein [Parabacteroides sp. PH5-8]MDH6327867.1 putative ABC transport system permease protein [Parabacteroide